MKKVRRQIAVLLGIVLCAAVSEGCSGNAYHAELALLRRSVDLNGYIREDFLEENRVFGAFYPIGEAEDGTADYEQLTDESYPRERIFCIRSEEEFNGVFVLPPQELKADFQTQMLVVYTQACMYSRPVEIKRVEKEGEELFILFGMEERRGVGDASMPAQIYLFVVMDALDVTSIACALKIG